VLRSRLTESDPASGTMVASRQVVIDVADTGSGMDAETERRCLEPFYTTKGERGTGLGLAMVYGMAQRHRADIGIESAPGRGTTVRLTFAAADRVSVDVEPDPPAAPVARLRVLAIDDDPLLLKSLSDALSAEGHLVTVAEGGQAGIDLFSTAQRSQTPFDVVITDLGMPHVNGRQVADQIKAQSPGTRIILLTGWGTRLESGDELMTVDRVMHKPPKLSELRGVLAATMSEQP
jgi:CheY-like chemotaxis protein